MKYKRVINYLDMAFKGTLAKALPSGLVKQHVENSLNQSLKNMRGVPSKIHQIKSMKEMEATRPSAYPIEELLEQTPELFQILDQCHLSDIVKTASLGQVHFLDHPSYGEVALKIRYPGAADWMKMDNKMMELSMEAFSTFKNGFSTEAYKQFFTEELLHELDYHREFQTQLRFYDYWKKENPSIITPKPFQCGDGYLLMSLEEGVELKEFLTRSTPGQKKQAQNLLLEFYFKSIFNLGLIHADPNIGNIHFRLKDSEVELIVYDYGTVFEFEPTQRFALLNIFNQVMQSDENLLPNLVLLGFTVSNLNDFKELLLPTFQILLEPFVSDFAYDLSKWNRKNRISDLLMEKRFQFMATAPVELFPLMRAFHGILFYCENLNDKVYSRGVINDLIKKYKPELMKTNVSSLGISTKQLCIQVTQNGVQKVKLHFPLKAIHQLENIIPPSILDKLKADKVSIEELKLKALKSGFMKMTLFQLKENSSEVLVFISE